MAENGIQEYSAFLKQPGSNEAELAQHNEKSNNLVAEAFDWTKDNVAKPFVNNAVLDPYDIVAHTVNFASEKITGSKPLWEGHLSVQQAQIGTKEWVAQSVSGGFGSLLPYLAAGKLAGGGLRMGGEALGAEGAAAAVLQSDKTAMIMGAALYDGAKTPEKGQTRLGNALGGAAAFGVFEFGNPMIKDMALAPKIAGLAAIGAGGATAQLTVSDAISQHRLPTWNEVSSAAISGGAMNLLLPATQHLATEAFNRAAIASGRGVNVDRYIARDQSTQQAAERSQYMQELMAKNAWAKVQPGSDVSRVNNGRIEIAQGDASPEKFTALLHQYSQQKPGAAAEAQYRTAAEQVKAGNVDAARETFQNIRLAQELGVRQARAIIGREVSGKPVTEPVDVRALSGNLPNMKVADASSTTYGELWDREFDHFVKTNGAYRPPLTYFGTDGSANYQNMDMRQFYQDQQTPGNLNAITQALRDHRTLTLMRYDSGGHSAVTPMDWFSLQKAIDGELINHWDRDNITQSIAERTAKDDPSLLQATAAKPDAWRAGLFASLKHHTFDPYFERFTKIISGERSGLDFSARPNIRYNPVSLMEINEPWGHAQNDSLGFVDYMLFHSLNRGDLTMNDPTVKPLAEKFGAILPNYFKTIHVWEDWDLGAWEDNRAEHASSIGVALAAMREQLQYVQKNGPVSTTFEGKTYTVDAPMLQDLISRSEAKLREVLPNESIRGNNRGADAALVNPLFLSALSGRPLLDDATTVKVINNIEQSLMSPIGIRRYENDVWDGRVNRNDLGPNEEAQWSHVSPMISYIFGEMYRRTGDPQYLERQTFHFNRTLGTVNEHWKVPEAYIPQVGTHRWISDENEPLAWAQSATVMALDGMKRSLQVKQAAEQAAAAKPN